jgi:hypothetical protein
LGSHTLEESRSPTRRLFVSYAREDRQAIRPVIDGIERLNYAVWVDGKLAGGKPWWDEILSQIRGCDGLVVPISPALLDSEACKSERDYAAALGKPILPIMIVTVNALPTDLATLQVVDYTTPGAEAAFELAGALAALPPPAPLPEPLPESPPVPKSYLLDLAARVHAPSLNLEDQLSLVAQLRAALRKPQDRNQGLELLKNLQERRDLYAAVERDIADAIKDVPEVPPEPGQSHDHGHETQPSVPPGWYEDPSGRHEMRWFDGDWTSWAADGGKVVEDPLS